MANQSAKRIAQQNQTRMRLVQRLILGVNGAYVLVRYLLQYSTVNWTESVLYLLTVLLELMLYFNLSQISRPRYDSNGTVIDSGTDLEQPGMVSYMFDYIYISWFVHTLSLLTRWAWWLYLSIPLYLSVVFGPYLTRLLQSSYTGTQPPQMSDEDEARAQKRKAKKDRKQQRVKYMH